MVRDDKPANRYHEQDDIPPQFSDLEGDELIKALLVVGAPETWIQQNTDWSKGKINAVRQALMEGRTKPPTEAVKYARERLGTVFRIGIPLSEMETAIEDLADISGGIDSPQELSEYLHQLAEIHGYLVSIEEDELNYKTAKKVHSRMETQNKTQPARVPSMSEAARSRYSASES